MENWYGADLTKQARQLSRGEEKRKLAMLHGGVLVGVTLAVTLAQLLLEQQIEKTGGLSGMGLRSILQTVSTVLQAGNSVATPFWNLGFLYAALLWAGHTAATPRDLLTGFRRFGPYLRLLIGRYLLTVTCLLCCAYLSAAVYMMTPWAKPVTEFAYSVGMDIEAANGVIAAMDTAQMDAMLKSMIPMLVIWGVMALALLVPLLYRFRMAEFVVLEDRRMGGMVAMLMSARMLRKRRFRLFLLDLRFWWYYLLQVLCLAVCFAESWLPLVGVALPQSLGVSLALYGLYLLALFAVHAFLAPRVQTAYALAYTRLRQMEPEQPKPKAAPKNLPWEEQ